jgi:hypothetical protein
VDVKPETVMYGRSNVTWVVIFRGHTVWVVVTNGEKVDGRYVKAPILGT